MGDDEGPFDDSTNGSPFDDDSFDEDEFLEAWAEAERQAVDVLVAALADTPLVDVDEDEVAVAAEALRQAHADRHRAARWMLEAAGIDAPEDLDDQTLLVQAAAATISMVEDPGLPPEQAASIMTLELADWVGAILGLVRAGPGAAASPEALVDYGIEVDEVDAPFDDPADRVLIEHGFALVLPAWQACGAVDDERLTRVGCWLLPTAAVAAWTRLDDGEGADVLPFPGTGDAEHDPDE